MEDIEDGKAESPDRPKRSTGRPPSGKAKTAADRQRARRERLRVAGVGSLTVELPLDVIQALDDFVRFKDISKDDVILRLLRSQLLRKR